MSVEGIEIQTIKNLLDPLNAAMVKKYYDNDGDGYPTDVYYAEASAQNGDDCLRQRIEYATVSGVKSVVKESWEASQWSASWDI